MNGEFFLEHERDANPRQVRIRSAELRHAQAYWVRIEQRARPLEFMLVDAEVVDRNVIRPPAPETTGSGRDSGSSSLLPSLQAKRGSSTARPKNERLACLGRCDGDIGVMRVALPGPAAESKCREGALGFCR
jgi:hypothetical protein